MTIHSTQQISTRGFMNIQYSTFTLPHIFKEFVDNTPRSSKSSRRGFMNIEYDISLLKCLRPK